MYQTADNSKSLENFVNPLYRRTMIFFTRCHIVVLSKKAARRLVVESELAGAVSGHANAHQS